MSINWSFEASVGEMFDTDKEALQRQHSTQTSLLDLSDFKMLPPSPSSFMSSVAVLPMLSSAEYDFLEVRLNGILKISYKILSLH